MKFAFVTVALAAIAGIVQGQSTTAKPSGGSSSMSITSTTRTSTFDLRIAMLCASYGLAIPACGTTALLSLASSIAGCGMLDFPCQCSVSGQVQPIASSPIIAACGLQTALTVQGAADQLCNCVRANMAPVSGNTTGSQAAKTGAAAPGFVRAAPTDPTGALLSLGGAIAAVAGVVAVL